MRSRVTALALVFASFFCLPINNVAANESVSVKLDPETVELGTFYNGTTIKIEGTIPAGADAVIRLSGEGEELHLKRKGKVGGLLWMNVGDLTFHNAPRVFKLLTPKGITDLSGTPVRSYGFEALKDRIEINPESQDNDSLLNDFVKLKEEEEVYSISPASISYGPSAEGVKSYTGIMDVPSIMAQGVYTVETVAFQDGSIVGSATEKVTLKQAGLPEKLSEMAFGHEILYGIMSVVIAVMAGLFMGVAFKDKGGAH